MDMHPRTKKVRLAQLEIESTVLTIVDREQLTHAEAIAAIAEILRGLALIELRRERHPNDPDHPADLAADG